MGMAGKIYGDLSDLPEHLRRLREMSPMRTADPDEGIELRSPRWTQSLHDDARALTQSLTTVNAPEEEPEEAFLRAREEARQQGYEEGMQSARETIETLLQRYHAAIEELGGLRDEILAETENDVVNLSLLIAREALMDDRECEGRRDYCAKMANHSLRELRGADQITLRVGAADADALRDKHPDIMDDKTTIRVIADPSMEVGGVVAECELGRVDARLQRRLVDIGKSLLGDDSILGQVPDEIDGEPIDSDNWDGETP